MAEVLKPRDFGDLLAQNFKVVFGAFRKLLMIHLLVWVPLGVLAGLVFGALALTTDALEDNPALLLLLGGGAFLLLLLVSPLGQAASILVIADQFIGTRTTVRQAFTVALRRLFSLIGLGFVVTLVIGVWFLPGVVLIALGTQGLGPLLAAFGFLFCVLAIIPAIYWMLTFFVGSQALLLENASIGEALARSRILTAGFRPRILGLFALITLIAMVVGSAVKFPVSIATVVSPWPAVAFLGSAFAEIFSNVVSGILGSGLAVVVYFDLRVRKDGFDLENLAELVDVIREREAAPPKLEASGILGKDPMREPHRPDDREPGERPGRDPGYDSAAAAEDPPPGPPR